jgi:hypothetical protein
MERKIPGLIVIFDLFGIAAFGLVMKNWPIAVLFISFPTLFLGLLYANIRLGLKNLRKQSCATPDVLPSGDNVKASDDSLEPAGESKRPSEQFDFLFSIPRPRPVRLTRRGRTIMTMTLVGAIAIEAVLLEALYSEWDLTKSLIGLHAQEGLLACLAILIALIPFFIRRMIVRDQDLITGGAVVRALVTNQRRFKNTSSIQYEFQAASGRKISDSANDYTHSFFEGMTVPVFYDPRDPSRNVAACASFFEVEEQENK